MGDLISNKDENIPAYHRQNGETSAEYEMFFEWAKIPPSARTLGNYCRRTGYNARIAKKTMAAWNWEDRAAVYDSESMQLRPDPASMDEEATRTAHIVAAKALMETGLTALQMKDPTRISVADAMKLASMGFDMHTKAVGDGGEKDFKADDIKRINDMLQTAYGGDEDIVDAEVIDEGN